MKAVLVLEDPSFCLVALPSSKLSQNLYLLASEKKKGVKKIMPPLFKVDFPEAYMKLLLMLKTWPLC